MPPEVGKAGPKPITQPTCEGVQETNSAEVEKKSAEKPKEEPVRRQASVKEANAKKHDIAREGDYRRTELNRKMIRGSKGDDNIHISKAQGLAGKLGLYEVNINGNVQYQTKQQLEHTQFSTGDGNDRVVVDPNVKANVKVDGGRGDDFIVGGSGDDNLTGGKGNDRIFGRGGKDNLYGGKGDDTIRGGRGNDYIDGGSGKDKNIGGQGVDFIKFDRNDHPDKFKKK